MTQKNKKEILETNPKSEKSMQKYWVRFLYIIMSYCTFDILNQTQAYRPQNLKRQVKSDVESEIEAENNR